MADYKRLITYAYNYESGTKKQNVGHARVEVFGNELKVKVNIKVPGFSGKVLKLYFYKRIRGGLNVAYLCDVPIAEGIVDEKVQADTSHIGDSELNFNELDGFILYYNPTKCIVSDWKDKALTYEELNSIEATKPKKAANENSNISQVKSINDKISVIDKDQKDLHKVQEEAATGKILEVISDSNLRNDIDSESDYDASSSKSSELELFKNIASKIVQNINKTKDSNENSSNAQILQAESSKVELNDDLLNLGSLKQLEEDSLLVEHDIFEDEYLEDKNINDENLSEQESVSIREQQNADELGQMIENELGQMIENELEQMDQNGLEQMDQNGLEQGQENESALDQEINDESEQYTQEFADQEFMDASNRAYDTASDRRTNINLVAAATTGAPIENQGIFAAVNEQVPAGTNKIFPWRDSPAARKILNGFPRVYPFEDGEIAECVKIEPKDIGLLPMEHWGTGNNSFLLHGYNNYHHLLFSKKQTRNGCLYLLMVPGVYNAREKYMARLFGFEYFKCAKRRNLREGEFGYWYLTISF